MMLGKFAAVVVAACLAVASLVVAPAPASAWDLGAMNRTINQTNFIVDNGCSGTLISLKEKLVLTNHHCIDRKYDFIEREETQPDGSMRKVKREVRYPVSLAQRAYQGFELVGSAEYVAEIVAHKRSRDLALLRIRADEIPHRVAAPVLPEDKQVQRGESVWAVGNPNSLDATVTFGVVSSLNRASEVPWAERGEKVPFIQFSGGIWYGNSGGALYNDEGYLIGVPGAIAGTAHLGLAIPASEVRKFLKDECLASVYDPKADDAKCRVDKAAAAEKEKK